MPKMFSPLFLLLIPLIWFLCPVAGAVELEFNVGLAYDRPTDKPLPELSDGFGYNLGACLWLKQKYGLAIGVAETKHDLAGGTIDNRLIKVDSKKNTAYIEARYKLLVTKHWEIVPLLGATISNEINGGDQTGSYLQYTDYDSYDSESIGYTGSGYWFGMSVYRPIFARSSNHLLFASIRYNLLSYSRVKYFGELEDQGVPYLVVFESDTNRAANSFSVMLGVVLRFSLSNI